jgi:putative FmdB family regulatory protein
MPNYEFRCDTDKSYVEIQQGFYDDNVPDCPLCGQVMRKVIHATPTFFNAKGFYRTGG